MEIMMRKIGYFLLGLMLLLAGCEKPPENPRLEKIKAQALELHHKKLEIEENIKKTPEEDAGKRGFLVHDLELLKSRMERLKEEARVLNGGIEVHLEPAPQGGGGH